MQATVVVANTDSWNVARSGYPTAPPHRRARWVASCGYRELCSPVSRADRSVSSRTDALACSPELKLALALARTPIGAEQDARIRAELRGPINWTAFRQAAHRLEVAPLLFANLVGVYPDHLPTEVREELTRARGDFRLYSLTRTMVLLDVIRVFHQNEIACVPLKGPVLASQVYGDISLRAFADLDLLVSGRDIAAARDLLLERGFVRRYDAAAESALVGQQYALEFDKGPLQVDLHGSFAWSGYGFHLEVAAVFGRTREISVEGTPVRTLSPEDSLLYLCAHGTKHGWDSLRPVCDVAQLIRDFTPPDWERSFRLAREVRSERLLRLGLLLASEHLVANVPDRVLRSARADRAVTWSAERISRQLARTVRQHGTAPSGKRAPLHASWRRSLIWLGTRERLRDQLRYLLRRTGSWIGSRWP